MALVGVELETLVSEPDALTIRPPPCARIVIVTLVSKSQFLTQHHLVHAQAVAFTLLIKSSKSTVVTVVQILMFK